MDSTLLGSRLSQFVLQLKNCDAWEKRGYGEYALNLIGVDLSGQLLKQDSGSKPIIDGHDFSSELALASARVCMGHDFFCDDKTVIAIRSSTQVVRYLKRVGSKSEDLFGPVSFLVSIWSSHGYTAMRKGCSDVSACIPNKIKIKNKFSTTAEGVLKNLERKIESDQRVHFRNALGILYFIYFAEAKAF